MPKMNKQLPARATEAADSGGSAEPMPDGAKPLAPRFIRFSSRGRQGAALGTGSTEANEQARILRPKAVDKHPRARRRQAFWPVSLPLCAGDTDTDELTVRRGGDHVYHETAQAGKRRPACRNTMLCGLRRRTDEERDYQADRRYRNPSPQAQPFWPLAMTQYPMPHLLNDRGQDGLRANPSHLPERLEGWRTAHEQPIRPLERMSLQERPTRLQPKTALAPPPDRPTQPDQDARLASHHQPGLDFIGQGAGLPG